MRRAALLLSIVLILGGCAADEERRIFAGVNIAISDVPLDEIVFDTFDGGSVSLAEADEASVLSLVNVIRPLDVPAYVEANTATYLRPTDLVLGYVADDGSAWAHPHRVLNFHEIVNTTLADRPVAVTYCPLCGSGVVFDRRPDDLRHEGVLTFDNTSALYENDMVMVDPETNTYWWHMAGQGIVGNLTGSQLQVLPSTTTTWEQWQILHPDTSVLSDDQGRGPRYQSDPFADYGSRVDAGDLQFPVSPEALEDDRLARSTRVIGLEIDGQAVAVPVFSASPAVVHLDGPEPVVVFLDGAGGGSAFRSGAGSAPFVAAGDGFVDAAGTRWDLGGLSSDGVQLTPVPSRTAFWFAWVAFTEGETLVVGPTGEIAD